MFIDDQSDQYWQCPTFDQRILHTATLTCTLVARSKAKDLNQRSIMVDNRLLHRRHSVCLVLFAGRTAK